MWVFALRFCSLIIRRFITYYNHSMSNFCYLNQDSVKGRGVYAINTVPPDTVIMTCPTIGFNILESAIILKTKLWHYVFRWRLGDINGLVCIALGYGSLVNHSTTPNVKWIMLDNGDIQFITMTYVEKDSEFLIDYGYELPNMNPSIFSTNF